MDCREVALTEGVVFRTKETVTLSVWLFGIGLIVHDAPAYERAYTFSPVPRMQQQSIAVMRSVVNDETCESHWVSLLVASTPHQHAR
jgi:hypothetical protein